MTLDDPSIPHLSRRRLIVGGTAGLATVAVGGASLLFAAPSAADTAARRRPEDLDGELAMSWFDLVRTLVRTTPGFSPPVASRVFAYAGITLYEAVVPGARHHRSLHGALPGLPRLPHRNAGDWQVVANAALGGIVARLFPMRVDLVEELEATLLTHIGSGGSPAVVHRSVERGRAVARAIFHWSRDDGGHEGYLSNFPSSYVPPTGAGLWVPTPPAHQPALQPYWGANRCFAIAAPDAVVAGQPTPYDEATDSAFGADAAVVRDTVNRRDPEEADIARFWSDDPAATSTPPGHSVSIATQVLRGERASLLRAAETYAKVGIAVADAFISCWHRKYSENVLRPVTHIQRHLEADWLPLLTTPPFPEYPSGHSVQSAAAAEVLTDLFGDGYRFEDRTPADHPNSGLAPRHFDSFRQAAHEAAMSRLYGGIHFLPAIEHGLAHGRLVGTAVNALPVRD